MFASVTAADGVYQPVYTVQGLAGATYEIKAAADIYTPDGTLRCSAGEVVDTVTTGADGMVVNKGSHTAELVYAGQEIEITETAVSFCNDRQKARISLSKVLEQNKQFGIGMNNELSAVTFGFYAAEELIAADGCPMAFTSWMICPKGFPSPLISIHAPRTGSDACPPSAAAPTVYFNPRSPHGERLGGKSGLISAGTISIHAPRTGSDKRGRAFQSFP